MREPKYYRAEYAFPVNHRDKPMTVKEIMSEAWISIDERMPELYETVIVSILSKNGYGEPATIESMGWFANGKWDCVYPIHPEEHITHWMPMPDSPGGNA